MSARSLHRAAAIALLLAGAWSAAAAQGYEVRAFIQPEQDIGETQTLRLVIEVRGGGNPKLTAPSLGQLQNLQIISGPDRRFNSVWNNGRFSSTTQLIYTLLPKGPGAASIPALRVLVDGQPQTTQPIEFEVLKQAAGVPPPRAPDRGSRSAGQDRADVFLRARIGSTDVWVGESVPLTVSVFTAERISTPSLAGQPSLSSFWVEEVDVDPEAEGYQTTIDGRRYVVYPMVRKVLVPQTAGEIEIEPFIMQIPVRVRGSGDAFDFFNFGRNRTVVRKTEPITLRVRPLPQEDRPDDFSGAVGDFRLRVALDREEAAVNDAVALTATVEGEGFLRAAAAPDLDALPDLKVFDPKVSSTSRTVQGKLVSRKTWEWILVPLAPGDLKVPEVRFPYFDTNEGIYKIASGRAPTLVVRQGGPIEEPLVARGDIQLQRRDLAFIKPLRGQLRLESPRLHERRLFLTALVAPLLWVPLLVLVGRHRARLQQNLGLARGRKAWNRARKRLRSARRRLDSEDSAGFHEEVARAVVGYVADRFDRSAAGLTYELADELLASKGLELELRRRFRACLERCDFARFVPSSADAARRAEIVDEAEAVLERVEKAW